jgi:hypothetical protein
VLSLTDQLATLALEVVGILGAVALVIALTVGRRPKRAELRFASAMVAGVLAVVVATSELPVGASVLNQARRSAVSARVATEYCFGQVWPANPGGAGAARLPFLRWLKARIGPQAVYAIAYAPPPDADCLFLGLLPALPAAPGEHADWTIAFGVVPAEMKARIAAHEASVRVFAPGFALESDGKP